MTAITLTNLTDFIRGAAILGTGGGGDPYLGRLMLVQELLAVGSIELLDPDKVAGDWLAVSVASMGAPTVFVEKVPNADATIRAMRRLELAIGRKFDAVIPLEAGGVNATLPLVVGARTGLPVVDADGMGRAFPELQMTTFNINGVPICPLVTSDDHGNSVLYETNDAATAERFARAICVRMGGIAQTAMYCLSGADIRRSAVPKTISMSVEIGAAIRRARSEKVDPCLALVRHFEAGRGSRAARILFDGKVTDIKRETRDGFAVGRVFLEGNAGNRDRMEIDFRNEFSVARTDGRVLAIVPDLICALDRETGEPITTESLRYGQRLKIVGIAAAPVMRTPPAMKVFGPEAFGLSEPFTPLEEVV